MASLPGGAVNTDNEGSMGLLAEGWYRVRIEESEVVQTQNRKGWMSKWRFKVVAGPRQGAVFFEQYLVRHEKPEAEGMGRARVADLCRACGVREITDTAQLHGRVFDARVGIKQDDGYDPKNILMGSRRVDSGPPQGQPQPPPPQGAAPQGAPQQPRDQWPQGGYPDATQQLQGRPPYEPHPSQHAQQGPPQGQAPYQGYNQPPQSAPPQQGHAQPVQTQPPPQGGGNRNPYDDDNIPF